MMEKFAIDSFTKAILLGAALILLLSGCPSVCPDTVYNFAITASILPNTDSVRVGDTLLLRSSFSTQLRDLQTNKLVDYSNATAISSNLFVDEILPNAGADSSALRYAVASFTFIRKQGQVYTDPSAGPQRVKQLTYQQNGSNYELAASVIPLKKGLFLLSVTDGFSSSRNGSRDCNRAAFQITLLSNKQKLPYVETAFNRPLNRNDSLHFYVVKVY